MADSLTPMMQQYQSVRRELPPNTLLLFRLGDFYEMFFEDAKEASGLLNVALTKRNGVPMCGVPYHAAENYIAKLVKAGKRVAVCDQVGEVRPGKIVARELTHIVSPGTVIDLNQLEANRNHFLAAAHAAKGRFGLACVDLSTGDFRVAECATAEALRDELARIDPSELLVPDDAGPPLDALPGAIPHDGYAFGYDHAFHALKDHFRVQSLDGFGCADLPAAIGAAGAALHYLSQQLRRRVDHITSLRTARPGHEVELDAASQENLELVQSKSPRGTSLLAALDRTVTPLGARRLRDWILHPLRELAPLLRRQEFIAALLAEPFLLSALRESLRGVRDIERTLGRLTQASGNARDLQALRASLAQIPDLREHLNALGARTFFGVREEVAPPAGSMAGDLLAALREFPDLVELLGKALVDEPPATLREGGMIRDGHDPELDTLRAASRDGKDWLAQLERREIERTGVKSLKVRYNSVFGYYIELTKSNLGNVPADYTRKQTLANAERFITPELKEMEAKILGADERARGLEYDLFLRLREAALRELRALQAAADAIASLDALCGLAETARLHNYCRPELHEELLLEIRDGRHPVLDQQIGGDRFVPNDILLDGESNRLLIITGPNMAGKSTFIRQVALLALMAQIGSYLPASSARVGLADKIFTRVGASDDLSRGQSTFMVEMNETANIVNNATARSLVILDEIGRGTSTFDGLAIAWSVAEDLHDRVRARTLFATHYHELTDLAATRPGVKNHNVAVREWNDQIIFLHKIVPGAADKSYGIHVARLAGLPAGLIERAKEILANLERAELSADGQPALAKTVRARVKRAVGAETPQFDLFASGQPSGEPGPPGN